MTTELFSREIPIRAQGCEGNLNLVELAVTFFLNRKKCQTRPAKLPYCRPKKYLPILNEIEIKFAAPRQRRQIMKLHRTDETRNLSITVNETTLSFRNDNEILLPADKPTVKIVVTSPE